MAEKRKKRLFGAGLGAGLLGAIFLALRYAVRPVSKARVPDTISPAIFQTKALHTSLGQVVYHESGSGPTLVFIHGICPGASSYEWSKVYPQFAASHRVLAPDLIGFGESARPDAHLTATDYARSMGEFIRGTCDEPVTVVASGLGAGLSVLLASQHPEVVRQLILWMPSGVPEGEAATLGRRLASMAPLVHRFIYRNYESSRAAVRGRLAAYGYADAGAISDETVEVYATCAQQYGAEHAIRNVCAGRLNVRLEERLAMVTQPVTLLWPGPPGDGASAASVPPAAPAAPETAARLQSAAKGCRLVLVPRVMQLAAIENPADIAALLAEEVDPGPKVVR